MKKYRLGRKARADLREIAAYIAKDNRDAALNWLVSLGQRFSLLASQPQMGEKCDDLCPGLRRISAGNYVIYFQPEAGTARIIRVLRLQGPLPPVPTERVRMQI